MPKLYNFASKHLIRDFQLHQCSPYEFLNSISFTQISNFKRFLLSALADGPKKHNTKVLKAKVNFTFGLAE